MFRLRLLSSVRFTHKPHHKKLTDKIATNAEQMEADIQGSKDNISEAQATVAKLQKEMTKLKDQLSHKEAEFAKAESKLAEERATLTRFDNELKELERVIKEKKQAISDCELKIKELEHDVQTLAKEQTASTNFVTSLEKQYEWIAEEHEYVVKPYLNLTYIANIAT